MKPLQFQLSAALLASIVLLCPLAANATRWINEDPHVPVDDWSYPVCDYMVEAGLAPGYSDDFFDGEVLRTDDEFAGLICVLFDRLNRIDIAAEPRLKFINVDTLKGQLFDRFEGYLKISSVLPDDPYSAWSRSRIGVNAYLSYLGPDLGVSDVAGLLEAKSAADATKPPTAYDEVPLETKWYSYLDGFCRNGVLKGYRQ